MSGYLRTVALRTLVPPTSIRPRAASRFETFLGVPVEDSPLDSGPEREGARIPEPPPEEPVEVLVEGASVPAGEDLRDETGPRPAVPAPEQAPVDPRVAAPDRGGVVAVEEEPGALAPGETRTPKAASSDAPGGEPSSRASSPGATDAGGHRGRRGHEGTGSSDSDLEIQRRSGTVTHVLTRVEEYERDPDAEGGPSPAMTPDAGAPVGPPAAADPVPAEGSVRPEIVPVPARGASPRRRTRPHPDDGRTITVTIGRIDVKAPGEERPREDERTIERPAVTLDDYLRRRDGRDRT